MSQKKRIVALTGAGISAESGIKTFRDAGGLWENHDVMEVASIDGYRKNPELVTQFYNERRKQAASVEPNEGHKALARLEENFEVVIVTQNVDNLHEKGGSTNVLHLHGELSKVRSTKYEELVYEWGDKPLTAEDKCEKGHPLRPHIVWFGEAVPMMETAVMEVLKADIFMVIGTSLAVYPAAGLLDYVPEEVPIYVIDPNIPNVRSRMNIHLIEENATTGVPKVAQELMEKYTQ